MLNYGTKVGILFKVKDVLRLLCVYSGLFKVGKKIINMLDF